MRGLRVVLIVFVILGGLFVAADRIAVGMAEDRAASELQDSEGLAQTPSVEINGFPFLTQLVGGELDEVSVGIDDYDAPADGVAGGTIRIAELDATMRGVTFSDGYGSATADSAEGSALIAYDELLKAANVEEADVAPGVTAKVTGLSQGPDGKVKVSVEIITKLGSMPANITSTVSVENGDTIRVHADTLPTVAGISFVERRIREVTDFKQKIDSLPAGIELESVEATDKGVAFAVTGSQVKLAG